MSALAAAIEENLGGVAATSGADVAARREGIEMTRDGDLWRIAFRGRRAVIKQSKGAQILFELVTLPGRDRPRRHARASGV